MTKPAFPTPEFYDEKLVGVEYGLTAREYFMAHAPAEPQPWFKPTMPDRPDAMWPNGRPGEEYPSNASELEAWDRNYQKQKYIQWPAAWADEMMRQR